MIGIIDYNFGNVSALCSTLNELDLNYKIISEPNDMENISHIIMPGVGSFDNVIQNLVSSGLSAYLCQRKDLKVLGICIGMHILGDRSEEGIMPGLGILPGTVVKLKNKLRTPHLGWNSVKLPITSKLFQNVDLDDGFYFLHNYMFLSENKGNDIAFTNYGQTIVSAVSDGRIYGVQFHPEKSGVNGKTLIKNFSEL